MHTFLCVLYETESLRGDSEYFFSIYIIEMRENVIAITDDCIK